MRIKVKDSSEFKNVIFIDLIDCLDILDGGLKTYEGSIMGIEDNILDIYFTVEPNLSFGTENRICPKKFVSCEII
jgi:hypothetical protein